LRSVAGALEELDVDDVQQEIDRTALLGGSAVPRFARSRAAPSAIRVSGSATSPGLYAVLARRDSAAGGRARGLERLRAVPAFLDAARAT
jgi:hypothetical protein